MGRDGTGIRIDKKQNAKGVKLNGASHDTASQITTESSETKKIVVEDRTVKDLLDEECQEKQDVLGVKNINCEVGPPEEKSVIPDTQKSSEKTLRSPVKPASGSDNFKMNSKVSQSFRYMTGTQASGSTLYPNLRCSPRIKDSHTPKKPDDLEVPSRSTAKKLQPDHRKYYDDEDNWSMASSAAASVRTVRSVTVPVAPSFSSAGRIAKRKEFYKMLEEKHKALEAEKREYEARMKEEQAAAIKQLRKSMAYKAKPVPSFYHEGPPPKVEPKKLPVTRPKSPNFTRRKSCGDAVNSPAEKGAIPQGNRRSLGTYREVNNTASNIKTKNQINVRNTHGNFKVKDHTKPVTEKHKASPQKITEEHAADISVES
ncbi:hypothetical protein DCAR_0729074 [Daucus carota subsp. sativus]|uniref:Uncharacterized protein n=1 Tax=Daucus carota subsp. sativus TaxID=79200 RepID=A0A161Y783_DAUCS|nr:PREDICTED: protein WVD2-like 1 [Daucus carota subsp. sativus]WOH09616.1 hypothetical protein DCAR_0729074 [Daucus carota subsp. sativus]